MKMGLLLIALAAVLTASCDFDDFDYELRVSQSRVWDAAAITQIDASTVNGDMAVSADPGGSVVAEIVRRCSGKNKADAEEHIENVVVTDSVTGGLLELAADMPPGDGRRYGADFHIFAPASTGIDLWTANGNVSVAGMTAGSKLTTINGNLLAQSHGGSIEGSTTNGNIDCDMAALAASGSAVLSTANGNATIALPAAVSATFDASTANGSVVVEGFALVTYTADDSTHKAGTIGAGGPSVHITSTNGNVTIRAR